MAQTVSEPIKPEFGTKMDDSLKDRDAIPSNKVNEIKQEADTTLDIEHKEVYDINKEVTTCGEALPKVKRFMSVYGAEGKANDVIYAPPLEQEYVSTEVESSTPDPKLDRVMIFFGGDMQDFPEAMDISLEQREHAQWNLENVAIILRNQFPERHIFVIRATRQYERIYSCYENFVPTAGFGNPDFTPYHGSLQHLRRLLAALSRLVNYDRRELLKTKKEKVITSTSSTVVNVPGVCTQPVNFERGDISIVGFSKGCVVLNQFLYEFHYLKTLTPDDQSFEDFLSSVRDIYWLDGGHSGGKNTWIGARSLLETLTRLKINIHVHVTPYQIRDELRPHIQREEKVFSESLKTFGAPIQRYVHFETQTPTLANHFELLAEFGSPSMPSTFDTEEWEGVGETRGMTSVDNYSPDDLKRCEDDYRYPDDDHGIESEC